MTNMAKCHLLMGHWVDAMKAAEIVMARDRKNIQAIEVKAESLYNSCFFEHALVLFHRGRVCVLPCIVASLTYYTAKLQHGFTFVGGNSPFPIVGFL